MASAPLSPQREPVRTVLANMSHSAFDYACGDGPARRDGLGVVEAFRFVREVIPRTRWRLFGPRRRRRSPTGSHELRRHLWCCERITGDSGVLAVNEQIGDLLVEALAVAA